MTLRKKGIPIDQGNSRGAMKGNATLSGGEFHAVFLPRKKEKRVYARIKIVHSCNRGKCNSLNARVALKIIPGRMS